MVEGKSSRKHKLKTKKKYFRSLDGVEYRIIRAVTRGWKTSVVRRDISATVPNPWKTIMTDIADNRTDMGICSMWMNAKRADQFDLSTFYDFQCHKFLVPRPTRLNEATAIYRTLSLAVWILFLCFFLVTGLLLMALSRIDTINSAADASMFNNFTRSMLEIVNIATGHGVNTIPKQHSINVLLIR